MTEKPAEGWNALRQAGKGDGTLEVPSRTTGVESGFGPARYALGPAGEPRLLVPCSSTSQKRHLGATAKLKVSVVRYRLSGEPVPFIDVMCNDDSLDAVFADIVSEILSRLAAGSGPDDATAGTIADFRELLIPDPKAEASTAEIVGLLGELLVLKSLCRRRPGAARAWTGPFELRHDFRQGVLALEVKASARSDATTVTINGADQLQAPRRGKLVLVHIRMERAEAGELRIETLFDELVAIGADREHLLNGMAELGCADPRAGPWNRVAFSLEGVDVYGVDGDFPRIAADCFLSGKMPTGISRVNYAVDLGHASSCRMTDSEFDSYLEEFLA